MEEIYLRGLLQNIIEKWFGKRDNATLYAVIISSALFGFGHIFGALGQPILTIICKAVWATALLVNRAEVIFIFVDNINAVYS